MTRIPWVCSAANEMASEETCTDTSVSCPPMAAPDTGFVYLSQEDVVAAGFRLKLFCPWLASTQKPATLEEKLLLVAKVLDEPPI